MLEGPRRRKGQCSAGNIHQSTHILRPRPPGLLLPSPKFLLSSPFLVLALLLTSTPVSAETDFKTCGLEFRALEANGTLPSDEIYRGPVKGALGNARNIANPVLLVTFPACEKRCGTTPDYYPWAKAGDTITTWVLPVVGLILQAPFESNNFAQTMFVVFRWVGSPIVSMMCIFWNMKVTRKCAILVEKSVGEEEFPPPSSFSQLRDSFYLLSVINQYELSINSDQQERYLEALLRVGLFDRRPELHQPRSLLAKSIRRERRRGTVQVLVSLGWFLVAMGISINRAFGDLGEDATAHNLALGLLMSWLPVLIAATIVDRNPMDSQYVRDKLNRYLHNKVTKYLVQAFPGINPPDLFGEFAGQGRVRWHYGVAHSLLRGLEREHGLDRGWSKLYQTSDELSTTRTFSGLAGFDPEEVWQMAAAVLMVGSCSTGAFLLSYYTPTVGLGCRSGGYMIFGLGALGCLIVEMLAWSLLPRAYRSLRRIVQWALRLCEFTNFSWLVYIVMAQTFGIYNTCRCKSSMWGGHGGYMDFENVLYYRSYGIRSSWMLGTLVTCFFLGIGVWYVVEQWCMQSFLWTQDWNDAMRGLRWVRRWKRATAWPRGGVAWCLELGERARNSVWMISTRGRRAEFAMGSLERFH